MSLDSLYHATNKRLSEAQDILALEGNNPVIIDNENADSLKYHGAHLIPVLVKAVQELSAENTALKARLDAAGI